MASRRSLDRKERSHPNLNVGDLLCMDNEYRGYMALSRTPNVMSYDFKFATKEALWWIVLSVHNDVIEVISPNTLEWGFVARHHWTSLMKMDLK